MRLDRWNRIDPLQQIALHAQVRTRGLHCYCFMPKVEIEVERLLTLDTDKGGM
jgi:hypothetical protein